MFSVKNGEIIIKTRSSRNRQSIAKTIHAFLKFKIGIYVQKKSNPDQGAGNQAHPESIKFNG